MTQAQRFPATVRGPTTIYRERMPIHEAALLGIGKKRDRLRDVVPRSKSPHRHAPRDVGIAVTAARLIGDIHFRLHPAGTNGIPPYAAPSPLRSQRTRQSDQ